jgi:hypothetical protein
MSAPTDNGGPAYPTTGYDSSAAMNGIGVSVTEHPGMTLRQYYAGQALAGVCANPGLTDKKDADLADYAIRAADALIAAFAREAAA